jgi:hypothetical protein
MEAFSCVSELRNGDIPHFVPRREALHEVQEMRNVPISLRAITDSQEMRRRAGAKCRVGEAMNRGVDAGGRTARRLRKMRHANAERAARHREQRCRRSALAAELGRGAGQAVGVRLQMRIGVRLHAELGDEQHQRQQMNDGTATPS